MTYVWEGSFPVSRLLETCIAPDWPAPPEAGGVYLVSELPWSKCPTVECRPLYVGSNTGRSPRFRTRIGDLFADLFGFYGEETGHHSGGQHLHQYCREAGLAPLALHLGWMRSTCPRCDENALVEYLRPKLNRSKPPQCRLHAQPAPASP